MDKIKPLFTATATATGGRNGHTESSDGMVRADLSVPQAMGGPGRPGTLGTFGRALGAVCRVKWSRSSEQIFRVDSGASAVVRLPSGGAAG